MCRVEIVLERFDWSVNEILFSFSKTIMWYLSLLVMMSVVEKGRIKSL